LKRLDPGIEIMLHRLAVFPSPVHLLLCQRPQRVLRDLDRLVVVEKVPCNVVKERKVLRFVPLVGPGLFARQTVSSAE
jgi:hypothetical protein